MIHEEDDLAIIELEGEKYEIIDTVNVDGHSYIALIPFDESDDPEKDAEFTILEMIDDPEDEENCTLKTIDDDDLYERIGEAFLEQFGVDEDYEDGE